MCVLQYIAIAGDNYRSNTCIFSVFRVRFVEKGPRTPSCRVLALVLARHTCNNATAVFYASFVFAHSAAVLVRRWIGEHTQKNQVVVSPHYLHTYTPTLAHSHAHEREVKSNITNSGAPHRAYDYYILRARTYTEGIEQNRRHVRAHAQFAARLIPTRTHEVRSPGLHSEYLSSAAVVVQPDEMSFLF